MAKSISIKTGLLAVAVALLSSLGMYAQDSTHVSSHKTEDRKKIISSFTGGMMLHIGYSFAGSPAEIFRNGSLMHAINVKDLPKDGVTLGLGGALRMGLVDHIHVGVEGGVSTMPLMKSGSNIRTGFGGVLCDYYFNIGKLKMLFGGMIGGGSSKRLFVPNDSETVDGKNAVYNASYTQTPFFMLDPYIGIEYVLTKRTCLLIKIDYMLPWGKSSKGLQIEDVKWSSFISPTGPRLYVGILFGKQ